MVKILILRLHLAAGLNVIERRMADVSLLGMQENKILVAFPAIRTIDLHPGLASILSFQESGTLQKITRQLIFPQLPGTDSLNPWITRPFYSILGELSFLGLAEVPETMKKSPL